MICDNICEVLTKVSKDKLINLIIDGCMSNEVIKDFVTQYLNNHNELLSSKTVSQPKKSRKFDMSRYRLLQ
jgi:hypothetical protein